MREPTPALTAHWTFPVSDLAGLRAARRDALDLLRRYGDPSSDFDSCAVVMSELMSNAALHGPGGNVRVALDWTGTRPLFAVSDDGTGFVPAFGLPPPNREGGRGLFLVKKLADTPEVTVDQGGCTVAVRLPVTRSHANSAP